VLDKRIKTWNFFWWEAGKRRSKKIGTVSQYPTKTSAWLAAKPLRDAVEKQVKVTASAAPTVRTLIEQYREEKMPSRIDTRRSYDAWLNNHVLPRWGDCSITDLQAREVEQWLKSLTLSPKSKVHIRGLLRTLVEFAMWNRSIPVQRNCMELVTVEDATKRMSKPRSLSAAEFKRFIVYLDEPFKTAALLCACLGLRISEALALRWSDVNWLEGKLTVERGIVRQHVDDVKTTGSRKHMSIDSQLLNVLKTWRQTTQFASNEDWVFASPVQLGRLPWSYPNVLRKFHRAAEQAGIGKVATHVMRHSYRSWLDAGGATVAVQQKLMRHASVTTTLNIYGDVVTDEMQEANSKVASIALNGR
jgi:integrase